MVRVGLHDAIDGQFHLIANGFRAPISLAQTGGTSTQTKLFRIDVNHVAINSSELAIGSFTVERKDASTNDWLIPTDCHMTRSTKTGLWVPEGHYKVIVKFRTIDGKQTQEHEISFPS